MDRYEQMQKGEKGAWLSITAYIVLSLVKTIVGYATNSQALIADGLNNTTDILASIAVLVGLRISRKPPDEDHPYGHFRAETVASLIAALIMIGVGIQVLGKAVETFAAAEIRAPDPAAAWTALASALLMWLVYRWNRNLARQVNSQAVLAAAKDNFSDALVSVGTAVGIFGSQWGLTWLDPLTAIIVGIVICKTGWEIFSQAAHHLTDGFDKKRLADLRQTVEQISGVHAVRDIKARVHGSHVLVDVIVLVDARLNVVESHDIAESVEQRLQAAHGIHEVHVHIEPLEESGGAENRDHSPNGGSR